MGPWPRMGSCLGGIPRGVEGPETGQELPSIQQSAILGLSTKQLSVGLALTLDLPSIASGHAGPPTAESAESCPAVPWNRLELGEVIEVPPAIIMPGSRDRPIIALACLA